MNKVKSITFDILLVAFFLYTGISIAALSPKVDDFVPSLGAVNIQWMVQWMGN
jgi:hypothetical protein